ncbi:PREDICTED: probable flavin-containing monooxygenase 1 [Nicotiana attenuata]|uniref:Flavin-containing monooxygenase n=1 Tax=Nicotiana attenuata TaxID=49451 RepID=A0A314KZH7_NICAT|nr:PREDICTED: probable flavin-containing monooxygenase 1 [Nicotiana attenuata]OIT34851.1 putative flavin-containing monooxygenase 1 [Nicotiana attenuata]
MENKRVAIIGAGISGLLACKYTLEKGFIPIVFEASNEIGGVWTQTIESTRLQSPKRTFEFTDFPWPSSVRGRYPHNTDVLKYIEAYAQHFELLPYIQLNTKVIGIDYVGVSDEEMDSWNFWSGNGKPFGSKGKWHILVQHAEDFTTQDYEVEFLILCVGRYSGLPNIPEFPIGEGPDVFSGTVIHSMEYSAMDNESARELIKGKRIAVIGSQKSAIDIAAECAAANGPGNPCTLVQRTIAWALPNGCFWWGINLGFLYGSRFSELLVHKPGQNIIYSALATVLSPLRWGFSKFVESYLRWNLPLKKYNMVPKQSFLQDMSSCKAFLLPDNFYGKVEEGSIILKQTQCFSFCKQGLIIDGEVDEPIKADLVIFATGYKGQEKLKNMFASKSFQNYIMGSPKSIVPLYRHIIHPRIPQLAIIGYSGSITNLHTSEMRCQWLAHFLDQSFKLPSIKEMEKEIEMWEIYMKKYAGKEYKRACIAALHIWYNDQLCKDIRCNNRRKKSFYDEWFQPYVQSDYVGLSPN